MTMTPDGPTVSRLGYTAPLKVANAFIRATEALGWRLSRVEIDSVIAASRRQTGLVDYGDPSFLVPMAKIIEVVRAKSDFTPLARAIMRQTFIRAISNRLLLGDWLRRHPAVTSRAVSRPIFVLGFPRTGTTLLQNLLAQHRGRRGAPFWELTVPVPMAEHHLHDRDLRRASARPLLQAAYAAAPEMAYVHHIDVDTLEECWPLFSNSFAVLNWDLSGLSDYGDWLTSSWDMHGPYQEYRRYLQVMLEAEPAEQLVLKCPEHLWFLDALLDVFPDACVVWTHRDPFDTLASYCSLMSLQWRTLYGKIDRPAIGAYMQQRLRTGIDRALDVRQRRDPARFFDVRFEELVRDPADVVRRMSQHFELPLEPDHDAKVAAYLERKRPDERGMHRYDASLYGLDRSAVHRDYERYITTVGVQLNSSG
jgi:Sulfotransferase family